MIVTKEQIPEYQEYPGLKNIACRAVLTNPGEYHIKQLVNMSSSRFAQIISGIIDETELTLTDPDNMLKLEWTIAMNVKSIFVNECMEEYLKKLDEYIGGMK